MLKHKSSHAPISIPNSATPHINLATLGDAWPGYLCWSLPREILGAEMRVMEATCVTAKQQELCSTSFPLTTLLCFPLPASPSKEQKVMGEDALSQDLHHLVQIYGDDSQPGSQEHLWCFSIQQVSGCCASQWHQEPDGSVHQVSSVREENRSPDLWPIREKHTMLYHSGKESSITKGFLSSHLLAFVTHHMMQGVWRTSSSYVRHVLLCYFATLEGLHHQNMKEKSVKKLEFCLKQHFTCQFAFHLMVSEAITAGKST